MNQKIDSFSSVVLPSPNTKMNHPKCDLGKDFSSQAFIHTFYIHFILLCKSTITCPRVAKLI